MANKNGTNGEINIKIHRFYFFGFCKFGLS